MKPLRSDITEKELEFVDRRLEGRTLPSLLENVKVAIRNDNLMTPRDKRYLEEVTQISDFEEFKNQRREAVDAYNEICDRVIDELEDFEAIQDPEERIAEMAAMFEEVIERDARRRGFDMVYGEDENISEYLTGDLEELVESSVDRMLQHGAVTPNEKEGEVNGYMADLMIPTTPSFEKRALTTFLTFLKRAEPDTREAVSSYNREELAEYIGDNFDRIDDKTEGVLSILFKSTSRQHLPTLSQKLKGYSEYVGSAEEELDDLNETANKKQQQKTAALEAVSSFLPEEERYSLHRKVDQIDQVHGFIYEDVSRHSNFRAVNDYFFRELIAETLHEIGELESDRFWEYPQQKLLDITARYSEDERVPA